MCRFKSGIILKSMVVIAPGSDDSHSTLLENMGIEDSYINASKVFVRAELTPQTDEWWISPEERPDKWKFIVDQDIVPDWFDVEAHEKVFRESVCDWWKRHVLIDQKIDELSSGYYRLKRCEVKTLYKDVQVMLSNSTVQAMRGNSTVQVMLSNSTVQAMSSNSTVQAMYDSYTVNEMWDSSTVNEMLCNSTVQAMYDSSIVRSFKEYPKIQIFVPNMGNFDIVSFKNKSED